MKKYERYLKNRGKKNALFLLTVIVAFFLIFFISRSYNISLKRKTNDIDKDIKELNHNIKSVKNEIEEIKIDYEDRNTDAYKEKIAREKLGMIKKDEYVYKVNDSN